MVYRMVTGKTTLLTEISRKLNEKICFKKTHDRLSRNINSVDLSESIDGNILEYLSCKVKQDTIIAIDRMFQKGYEDIRMNFKDNMEKPKFSGR